MTESLRTMAMLSPGIFHVCIALATYASKPAYGSLLCAAAVRTVAKPTMAAKSHTAEWRRVILMMMCFAERSGESCADGDETSRDGACANKVMRGALSARVATDRAALLPRRAHAYRTPPRAGRGRRCVCSYGLRPVPQ